MTVARFRNSRPYDDIAAYNQAAPNGVRQTALSSPPENTLKRDNLRWLRLPGGRGVTVYTPPPAAGRPAALTLRTMLPVWLAAAGITLLVCLALEAFGLFTALADAVPGWLLPGKSGGAA